MKRIQFFDGVSSSTEPNIANVDVAALKEFEDESAYAAENDVVVGSIFIETGSPPVVKYYDGEWQTVATIVDVQAAKDDLDDRIDNLDTDDIPEGSTNLYHTDTRVEEVVQNNLDTDDLSEGSSNLYHTPARVNQLISEADLSDLNDVSASSPADGEGLVWDGTAQSWVPGAIGAVNELDDLVDVVAPSPNDGDALIWNQTDSRWEPSIGFKNMPEVENGYTQRAVNYSTDDTVPVVASGSNSDGEWVRWADGTQRVTAKVTLENVDVDSDGPAGIYSSGPENAPFPVAFTGDVTVKHGEIQNSDDTNVRSGRAWAIVNHGADSLLNTNWRIKILADNERLDFEVSLGLVAFGYWRSIP